MKPALVKRDKAIVYLFLGSGLRISELCAINCADIVPELKRINVIRKGEGLDKNKQRTDYVLLGDEVMQVLIEYMEEYSEYFRDQKKPTPVTLFFKLIYSCIYF